MFYLFLKITPSDAGLATSPTSQSQTHLVPKVMRNSRYSRLSTSGSPSHSKASSTHELLQQQLRQQENLVQHQDAQLSQMSESVGTLRNMSSTIGSELDEQAVMLDEFGAEIEQAETKLDATMRKMVSVVTSAAPFGLLLFYHFFLQAKVLNLANDRRQWMAIGVLSSAMVVLFVIIFAL